MGNATRYQEEEVLIPEVEVEETDNDSNEVITEEEEVDEK